MVPPAGALSRAAQDLSGLDPASLDQLVVWGHLDEVETVQEVLEDLQLAAQAGPAASRRGGDLRGPVGVGAGKGIIEVAVHGPAGEKEVPTLAAVRQIPR